MDPFWAVVLPGALLVAILYSSVGHGGASGYLALLVMAGFARPSVTPVVLALNIAVAAIGFAAFRRAGYGSLRLLLPFVITSMPAAFLGGLLAVSDRTYTLLVGGALLAAAVRFVVIPVPTERAGSVSRRTIWIVGPLLGAVLGGVAGVVGIGGGIFLSPVLLLMGWAHAKETAGISAGFIVLNSLTSLLGHVARGAIPDITLLGPLLIAVTVGGMAGSYTGASVLSMVALQRVLGVVLAVAGMKMWLGA